MFAEFYIKTLCVFILIHMKTATRVSLIILSIVLALIGLAVGVFFLLIEPNVNIMNAPNLDEARLASYSRTIKILDKNDDVLNDVMYDNGKYYVKLDELAPHTVNAFIAIEDKRFYSHHGVDYKRMASAFVSNVKSGKFREGASTITQQLIKNTHLSNEKTIKRKLNEIRLARQLEKRYDKKHILESYLNILYFGSGINGLGTASRVMFDIPASELSLAQSAALASIINNPTKYSPYNNPDNLEKRKVTVLNRMIEQKFITQEQYDDAVSEPLTFSKHKQNQFVTGLIKNACSVLGCSEKELFLNNYTLKTAYDAAISEAARNAMPNDADYYVRVLVLDNVTGGIACDETNTDTYINYKRSPASCIKPFAAYAAALENGYNPLSQILDEPTTFGDYSPKNFKNSYKGYQSLTDCLIRSSNVAAVKLVNDIGLDECKRTSDAFGITATESDGLSFALGGMENGVTLPVLANAYRTLANGGTHSDCAYLTGARSSSEIPMYSMPRNERRVIGDDTAYLLTDMLKQCSARGTAKKLAKCGIIAAKTGTNGNENGNSDCYCIAYTPSHTIAVWFGENKTPIDNDITGATCCEVIKKILSCGAIDTSSDFEMPDSVGYYEIDGNELTENHEVYLADPLLPKRYCRRALLSKKHLPIQKNIDIIDYFDNYFWENDIFGLQIPFYDTTQKPDNR